jgi:hypothetical protein
MGLLHFILVNVVNMRIEIVFRARGLLQMLFLKRATGHIRQITALGLVHLGMKEQMMHAIHVCKERTQLVEGRVNTAMQVSILLQ